MPYYRAGDYYRGDYYRGNYQAGGLFGTLGKIVKKVAGTALTVVPGGGVVRTALKLGQALIAPSSRQFGTLPGVGLGFGPNLEDLGGTDVNIPGFRGRHNGGRPGHYKKDGTWTDRARPRLNPLNLKALRRANRRAHGFLKAARSAVRYFVPKAKKGKAYVAFRKRK